MFKYEYHSALKSLLHEYGGAYDSKQNAPLRNLLIDLFQDANHQEAYEAILLGTRVELCGQPRWFPKYESLFDDHHPLVIRVDLPTSCYLWVSVDSDKMGEAEKWADKWGVKIGTRLD